MLPNNSPSIDKWLKLIRADGVGPMTFKRLLKAYRDIDTILGCSSAAFSRVKGIGSSTAEKIVRSLDNYEPQRELEQAAKLGVWLVHYLDKRYPPALRQLAAAPPVLYVKGNLARADNLSVSIVGSRGCSIYGQEQSSRFAYGLASAGITIVSGLARGIDTAAHRGALNAGGRTIAVQACGLAHIYPQENAALSAKIVENGALISEMPLNIEPKSEYFPARNRIIAGISMATIIAEADLRSGAMITAKYALENNREVMAIPGRIDSPLARGPNNLIKQGAKLIENIDDVMDELGNIGADIKPFVVQNASKAEEKMTAPIFDVSKVSLSPEEKMVYEQISTQELHCDRIVNLTDLPVGKINAALMALRLKGLIVQLPGNYFKRK